MPILTAIEERLDTLEKKITWKDIAKAAEVTKSALSHFKKDGTELKFPVLYKISQFVFGKDYTEVLKGWCLHLNQPCNIKCSLEYLALNRKLNELDALIIKIRSNYSSNKELIEWANGYEILASYLKGADYVDTLHMIKAFNPKTTEMQVLMAITEVWCRNKLREYSTMFSLVNGLEASIETIKDENIRISYSIRLKEALAYVHLYRFNNVALARKYAEEIFSNKISPTLATSAAYLLGMSYLFDNYGKCLGYIERHRELLVEMGRYEEIKIVDNHDIPFINNYWNKNTEQPETNDISEKAHYEATVGNKELAMELLDKAIEDDGLSGFKLYYKGLATGDNSYFMQSMIFFVNNKGDKFFANLPYEHLKYDPTYKPMVDLLLN